MFTDEATIRMKAGRGGDGAVSFRHEKYVPKGGPDGGDGGDGGEIFFVSSNETHTLSDYARKKDWQAQNGENGKSKRMKGKDGQDLVLAVPPGTLIRNEANELIYDFTKVGEKILIARGGRGGWGNVHFKSATRQSPAFAKKGTEGEEKTLKLELKLIADLGIIGLPNCGKSTFLARVSSAKPKIADYPFTTLEPNLGVAKIYDKQIILADIPGLIEKASEGKGLGDKFLRHIERTKILIHIIDINSLDLFRDYNIIRQELSKWSPELIRKKELVVLNKIDTINKNEANKIADKLSAKINKDVYPISAVSGENIDKLLEKISKSF
jgi:GTP-binding protein